MHFARILLVAFAFDCLAAGAGNATYVRERTDSGIPVFWCDTNVVMHFYIGDPPPSLSAAEYLKAAKLGAEAWSYPTQPCTDVQLSIVAEPEAIAGVGYDRKNVISFRQTSWCRYPPPPQDAASPEPPCYPSSALAVTTLFRNGKTGELLDTDIEVNAKDYTWLDLVSHQELAGASTADFQFAITHELGHVIGLDHTCYTGMGKAVQLKDSTGAPEPSCGDANPPAWSTNSIMYPSVSQFSDLSGKRVISPDDSEAVCSIYPHGKFTCPVEKGGCSLGGQTVETGLAWPGAVTACVGFLATLFLAVRKRRGRSGR